MKLPTQMIENMAADKHEIRDYLRHSYLDVEHKRLVSTTGTAMAVIHVEPEEGDTSGFISPESLTAARKSEADSIKANDSVALPDGRTFPRLVAQFPPIDRIYNPPKEEEEPAICLNAALLYQLATALYPKAKKTDPLLVKLYIRGKELAVFVESINPDSNGIIMPCRM